MAVLAAQRELRDLGDPAVAEHAQRFFKSGPGEYSEGDVFIGVRVPVIRRLVRTYQDLSIAQITQILTSRYHEERLFAVFVWVDQYKKGDDSVRRRVFNAYVKNLKYVNNWDIVDGSAYKIIGPHLMNADRSLVYKLVKSPNLWRRRVAIMTTLHWIKCGDLDDTFKLATVLLKDPHDLIHKATGWMLREAGKIDQSAEIAFLDKHYATMPRTMLRYAIEQFPEKIRKQYLQGRRATR